MLKITYEHYLKYEEIQYSILAEEQEEYIYDKNNEHDKVIREILMKKEEALNLINKALKPKEEIKEQIEWYEEKEEISLVDVNKYSKEELLQEDNILSKVMLIEKSKNTIEFIKNVEEILKTSNNKNLEKIKEIIRYKAEGIIEQEQLETVLKKVKIEKEEKTMTLAERIHENERKERLEIRLQAIEEGEIKGKKEGEIKGKIQGRLETINLTIRKMLGLKLDDEIIREVTGVKQKELEKIKKELVEAKI